MQSLYDAARHYDALFPGPKDLPFYQRRIASSGGPVLELACGTGRLTVPLAASGVDITGLDHSPAMLEEARRRAAGQGVDVPFLEADMRNYSLDRKFQFIFISTNSFSHLLELEDIESCLQSIRTHLEPDGAFAIDIFTPSARILTRQAGQIFQLGEYDDPDGKGRIVVTETGHYDISTQVNHSLWRYTNQATQEIWEHPFHLRMFFPQEINALLHYNGFAVVNKFGWYDDSPYADGAPKQLIVCRPAR